MHDDGRQCTTQRSLSWASCRPMGLRINDSIANLLTPRLAGSCSISRWESSYWWTWDELLAMPCTSSPFPC
jgi:hypothetical protein